MDLDDKLSEAFASWSDARDGLARLRSKLPPPGGGQLAQSPEVAALYADILAQEQVCERCFAVLLDVADQRAKLLDEREQDRRRGADRPGA